MKRERYIQEKSGTSEQIMFGRNEITTRRDSGVIPMSIGWKRKKHSEVRYVDTKFF